MSCAADRNIVHDKRNFRYVTKEAADELAGLETIGMAFARGFDGQPPDPDATSLLCSGNPICCAFGTAPRNYSILRFSCQKYFGIFDQLDQLSQQALNVVPCSFLYKLQSFLAMRWGTMNAGLASSPLNLSVLHER